jgi:hypothetical protein
MRQENKNDLARFNQLTCFVAQLDVCTEIKWKPQRNQKACTHKKLHANVQLR